MTAVSRQPARRSSSRLKGLLARPSSASGASRANSSAAAAARRTLCGSQPAKYSGPVKLWKSRINGRPRSAR